MKKIVFLILSLGLITASCGGDDDTTPPSKNYNIKYEVEASGGTTVSKIQYRDENGELVVLDSPTVPWEKSLTIRGGLALEAAAFGEIPFEGGLIIEATWSPAIDGQTAENENIQNTTPGSIITDARVDIEGRTLPR